MRFTYSSEEAKDWSAAIRKALQDPEGPISLRMVGKAQKADRNAVTMHEKVVSKATGRDLSEERTKELLEPYLDGPVSQPWIETNWVRGVQPVTKQLAHGLRQVARTVDSMRGLAL